MQTDSLFYRLFQTAPGFFFELIGQPPQVAQNYTFRSVELKQTAFRIDGVFLPTQETAPAKVYFLEVQFQKDWRLYRRLFAEVCLFLRQNPDIMDWQAVILYPEKSIEPSDLRPYQNWLGLPEIHRIYLDQLAEESSSSGIDLVRLIVEPASTAVDRAKQLLNQSHQTAIANLSQKAIIELIETIVVYKFPQLSRQEIEQMLNLTDRTRFQKSEHSQSYSFNAFLKSACELPVQLQILLLSDPPDPLHGIQRLTVGLVAVTEP